MGVSNPIVPLLVTCAPSTASSGRRADGQAFRKNSFYIVPGMTTAQGSHADRELGRRHEDHGSSRRVKTAMHYQHPELDVVRAALDYGAPPNETAETWA